MDTNDMTEMAWTIIVNASQVSDTLKAELGAMASRFKTEDEWLRGVRSHLEEILKDPDEYVDYWDLEIVEAVSADMIVSITTELCRQVNKILAIPINKRGSRSW